MDTPKTEQAQRTDDKKRDTNTAEQQRAEETAKQKKSAASAQKKSSVKAKPKYKNNVRKLRMERMMSKAELARRAGLSTLTIDRVEKGMPCRMDTKRKILEALGLTPSDRVTVFGEDD